MKHYELILKADTMTAQPFGRHPHWKHRSEWNPIPNCFPFLKTTFTLSLHRLPKVVSSSWTF